MIRFIKFLIGTSPRLLAMIIAVGACSGFASAGLIVLVSELFTSSADMSKGVLIKWSIWLGAAAVLVLILEFIAKWMIAKHGAARHRELHLNFVNLVLNDQLRRIEKLGVARHLTIYAEDMSQIGNALNLVSNVGVSFFVVLGCLAYLAYISIGILITVLLVAIPAGWVFRRMHLKSTQLARESFEFRDRHVRQFKDIVQGIKELKLNFQKRSTFIETEYQPTVMSHEKAFVSSALMFTALTSWTQLVYFGFMIAAMVFIIVSSANPELMAPFLLVALFMRSYIVSLLAALPSWARAGVILERLEAEGFELHSERPSLMEPTTEFDRHRKEGIHLVVKNLTYQYTSEMNDDNFSVGPLSAELRGGEIVFVVGKNGAGKTTFAKLLCGLYQINSGEIQCNGIVVDESNRHSYNEQFSAIFTDPNIFEFLSLSRFSESESQSHVHERIQHYLEKLQLQYKVTVEDQRLSTTSLSHGQKKRLALLAAYLENKPVLIFDEWAENQDPDFKKVFYHELLPELRDMGKLIIVISHEDQFYPTADRVLTLSAKQFESDTLNR